MRIILEEHPHLLDPSELLRPEPEFADKALSKFRDYSVDDNDPIKERVRRTYRLMHKNQTVDFVLSKYKNWILLETTINEGMKNCTSYFCKKNNRYLVYWRLKAWLIEIYVILILNNRKKKTKI